MRTTILILGALASTLLLAAACEEPELTCPEPDFAEPPQLEGFRLLALESFHCGGWTHDVPVYLHEGTGLEFVLVPGGSFEMGAPEGAGDRHGTDQPQHRVTVEPFLLARTEVSNGLFREWQADYTSGRLGGIDLDADELPAGSITWDDARAWCDAFGLRLPSEAEWEYACRAGTTAAWFWGDSEDEGARYANIADQALGREQPDFVASCSGLRDWRLARSDDGFAGPAPGGSLAPNAFGLFDMLGNVPEHCADPWHKTYAGAPDTGAAWEAGGTKSRVNRGGSWNGAPDAVRCARRGVSLTTRGTAGLRPAVSPVLAR